MRRFALLALFGLAAAGCVTPSIPIPPPDPAQMAFSLTLQPGGSSTVSLSYPPTITYEGGVAYVYNRSKGVGVIQAVNANGSIGPTPPLAAVVDDQIVVTVENDDQTVSTCVLLKEGAPSSYCP